MAYVIHIHIIIPDFAFQAGLIPVFYAHEIVHNVYVRAKSGIIEVMMNIFKNKKKDFKDRTVLVVEDNEVDRKIIVSCLKNLGFKVLIAENGSEGYIKAVSHKPDVILSDCSMPMMDGVEMCRQIKQDENTKDIPVIFLTGVDSPRNVIDCFEIEAESFMCKPISPKALSAQMEQVLRDHFN